MFRSVLRTTLAFAALMALMAPPLAAQPADALLQGFEPSGDWLLSVDGRDLPKAEIFFASRATAVLLRSSEFASPVLVNVSDRSVATLDLMKVARRADGRIDLLADALLAPEGSFQIRNQAEAHFSIGGKAVILKPRPWLLGTLGGAAVLDSSAGYQWRAKRYEPDPAVLNRLRGEKRDVRVLTFFGSWCPHCKEHLPLLLKVEQRLAGGRIRFDYFGLPSGFGGQPEPAKWQVDSVPTAIVLVSGQEVGRIPTSQWSNPEVALDLILQSARKGG